MTHPTLAGQPAASSIDMTAAFRQVMRDVPASVTIVTSRDHLGNPHGMAASAVIPVSMEPASILVAVNETAGLHPVLLLSGRLCVNFLAGHQQALIEPFSRTDLRHQRFASDDWHDAERGGDALPWLPGARACVFADVDRRVEYGTHTLFIARITQIRAGQPAEDAGSPLLWMGGRFAPLAA
ncbi:MAG: flavin reductase family protein [Burkholderiaceae bacterium]